VGIPQSARFAQYFRRLLSLKEAYVPDVQETIMPTMEVTNPFAWDSLRPRGEVLCATFQDQVGVANQFSSIFIRPAAGLLFVPTVIFGAMGAAVRLQAGYSRASANAANFLVTDFFRHADIRGLGGGAANTASRASTQLGIQSVGGAGAVFDVILAEVENAMGTGVAGEFYWEPKGIVLTRSDVDFILQIQTVNTELRITIFGYERALELQENN
jgi:hypothetical protein